MSMIASYVYINYMDVDKVYKSSTCHTYPVHVYMYVHVKCTCTCTCIHVIFVFHCTLCLSLHTLHFTARFEFHYTLHISLHSSYFTALFKFHCTLCIRDKTLFVLISTIKWYVPQYFHYSHNLPSKEMKAFWSVRTLSQYCGTPTIIKIVSRVSRTLTPASLLWRN